MTADRYTACPICGSPIRGEMRVDITCDGVYVATNDPTHHRELYETATFALSCSGSRQGVEHTAADMTAAHCDAARDAELREAIKHQTP